MIRIAHFSDLHYGTRTLAEADRCFGAAIDRAFALGAQAAVISGDSTDHPLDLHTPAAVRLAAQVRRLADQISPRSANEMTWSPATTKWSRTRTSTRLSVL